MSDILTAIRWLGGASDRHRPAKFSRPQGRRHPASISNFVALEWHAASVPFFDELVTLGRPLIADGYVALPDGPGIGAELDVEVARRYARPGTPFFAELPA